MEGFRPPGPSAKEDDKRRKKKNKVGRAKLEIDVPIMLLA
jgi:hypothetical protein